MKELVTLTDWKTVWERERLEGKKDEFSKRRREQIERCLNGGMLRDLPVDEKGLIYWSDWQRMWLLHQPKARIPK